MRCDSFMANTKTNIYFMKSYRQWYDKNYPPPKKSFIERIREYLEDLRRNAQRMLDPIMPVVIVAMLIAFLLVWLIFRVYNR